MTDTPLQGHRILVVEDNALLAMSLNDILKRAGANVVGPTGAMDEAEQIASTERLSGAMLDIKLDAKEVWPVARILITRGVPIMFCTGHFDQGTLPPEWSKFPLLVKPARPSQIIETLAKVLGPAH